MSSGQPTNNPLIRQRTPPPPPAGFTGVPPQQQTAVGGLLSQGLGAVVGAVTQVFSGPPPVQDRVQMGQYEPRSQDARDMLAMIALEHEALSAVNYGPLPPLTDNWGHVGGYLRSTYPLLGTEQNPFYTIIDKGKHDAVVYFDEGRDLGEKARWQKSLAEWRAKGRPGAQRAAQLIAQGGSVSDVGFAARPQSNVFTRIGQSLGILPPDQPQYWNGAPMYQQAGPGNAASTLLFLAVIGLGVWFFFLRKK